MKLIQWFKTLKRIVAYYEQHLKSSRERDQKRDENLAFLNAENEQLKKRCYN